MPIRVRFFFLIAKLIICFLPTISCASDDGQSRYERHCQIHDLTNQVLEEEDVVALQDELLEDLEEGPMGILASDLIQPEMKVFLISNIFKTFGHFFSGQFFSDRGLDTISLDGSSSRPSMPAEKVLEVYERYALRLIEKLINYFVGKVTAPLANRHALPGDLPQELSRNPHHVAPRYGSYVRYAGRYRYPCTT